MKPKKTPRGSIAKMRANAKEAPRWSVDPVPEDDRVVTRHKHNVDLTIDHYKQAIVGSRGSLRLIAERLGCSRTVAQNGIRGNKLLQALFDDEVESSVDTLEEALFRRVEEGDTPAIVFGLKTRGRHRGYNDKIEVEQNVSATVLGITAKVDESHALSDVMVERIEAFRLMQIKKAEYAKAHGLNVPEPPAFGALDNALTMVKEMKNVTPAANQVPEFLE